MTLSFPGGWRLFGLLTLAVALPAAAGVAMQGPETETLRWGIRFTARTSAALFLLAITASATARLWPNAFTRWQRANRRMFGLAFAFSHAVHAGFIVAFAAQGPEQYAEAITPVMIVAGAIGYTLIILMTLTSFRAPAALIGPKAWRVLHGVGVHWLWLQFVVAFGKRVASGPVYWVFLAALAGAMALRLIALRQKARAGVVA